MCRKLYGSLQVPFMTLIIAWQSLRNKDRGVQRKAAKDLRIWIENQKRELSPELWSPFCLECYNQVFDLISSSHVWEKIGGVLFMDELTIMQSEQNEVKIMRFSNYLKMIIKQCSAQGIGKNDTHELLQLSTEVLGHLTKAAGPLSTEMVEDLINIYTIELIHSSKYELKRLAGVWIIKQLILNVPTLLNIHLTKVISELWPAILDHKLAVREGGIEALRECLNLIVRRPQAYRQQFEKIYNKAMQQIQRNNARENHIHGSLLTFGELLTGGEHMMDKFNTISKQSLLFKHSKSKCVRLAVIELLPKLAKFNADAFVPHFLDESIEYLLHCWTSREFKNNCYQALGYTAIAVRKSIVPYLGKIIHLIQLGLSNAKLKSRSTFDSALECLSNVVCAVDNDVCPHLKPLIAQMFAGGLSTVLVDTLKNICDHISQLQKPIHEQLALEIWNILATSEQKPLFELLAMSADTSISRLSTGEQESNGSTGSRLRSMTNNIQQQLGISHGQSFFRRRDSSSMQGMNRYRNGSSSDTKLIHLALCALADFKLDSIFLLPFIKVIATVYLNFGDVLVRGQASLTCSALLARLLTEMNEMQMNNSTNYYQHEYQVNGRVVTHVLERLLTVGITDPNGNIRANILQSFGMQFDHYLSQNDPLDTLFIALNDEVFNVRKVVLTILGRLAKRNPGQVMPHLRKTLIQLLTELQLSQDIQIRQDSAELLGTMIDSAQQLVKPYARAIAKVLLPKLKEQINQRQSEDVLLETKLLSTIGKLSGVAGKDMIPFLPELLPLILRFLGDKFSQTRRAVALKSLSQLIQNTQTVVSPYNDHQLLLSRILSSFESSQSWEIRREAMRTLGIIGALDPFQHRMNSLNGNTSQNSSEIAFKHEMASNLNNSATVADNYYPSIALNALTLMLNDHGLNVYHSEVLRIMVQILHSLGSKGSVPFLSTVIPSILSNMTHTKEESLRKQLISQLACLVSIVACNIKLYLDGIFELIHTYWPLVRLQEELLLLIEQISIAMSDEFKVYLTDLIPLLLNVIHTDKSKNRIPTVKVLHTFEAFGSNLEDHLFLIISPLMRLCEQQDLLVSVRRECIRCITRLCRSVNFSAYSSRIIHPLTRIIDENDEELRHQASLALCALLVQMGSDYAIFITNIDQILKKRKFVNQSYRKLVDKLVTNDMRLDIFNEEYDVKTNVSSTMYSSSDNNNNNINTMSDVSNNNDWREGGIMGGPSNVNSKNNDDGDGDGKICVQAGALDRVVRRWDPEQTYTKEDWIEWMRSLQVELLKQSSNSALRLCAVLAQRYHPLAADLFNAAFLSCWGELEDFLQDELIRSQSTAFHQALRCPGSVPNEVLLTLLNLTEFMDRQGQALPVVEQNLGQVAEISHSYAKALYYKEKEFRMDPKRLMRDLVLIYNRLQQSEASQGIVEYSQQKQKIAIDAEWYEKLNRWEIALDAYERKQLEFPRNFKVTLGRMRCLAALGNWERVHRLVSHTFSKTNTFQSRMRRSKDYTGMKQSGLKLDSFQVKQSMASLGAFSSWHLNQWSDMKLFVDEIDVNGADGNFLRAILAVHNNDKTNALLFINKTREALDSELCALVGESYDRAYTLCVRAQQLVELEEILCLKHDDNLWRMWDDRLRGCAQSVDVWQQVLQVRSLVRKPLEDIDTWLKFSSLCRKNDRLVLSLDVLSKLTNHSSESILKHVQRLQFKSIFGSIEDPRISIGLTKHCWCAGMCNQAIEGMKYIISRLSDQSIHAMLKAKAFIKLGLWMQELSESRLQNQNENDSEEKYNQHHISTSNGKSFVKSFIEEALECFESATMLNPVSYWAWHDLALVHYRLINSDHKQSSKKISRLLFKESKDGENKAELNITVHVIPAVEAFFKSINLEIDLRSSTKLQDILRLLHLWFNHGHHKGVAQALRAGFNLVSVDTWLDVIPQIIARLQTAQLDISVLIQNLLIDVGQIHPQALVYPLAVACKSAKPEKESVVQFVIDKIREHSPQLVSQAFLVSQELIRTAILWDEMWYEALEEASRTYFSQKNPLAMFQLLTPLHDMMDANIGAGATTFNEIAFQQQYGRDLAEAQEWCERYRFTNNESDINQAWEYYAHVFRTIAKNLSNLDYLELQYVSPQLQSAYDLDLVVPGTYQATYESGMEPVSICKFVLSLKVMESKQRPRKLAILGSDGKEYTFLLKGHEDLRLDERVMQLFGLVNTLLATDEETKKRDLRIRCYSVIPLSPTTGILEWIPNCDTIHELIKKYRESRKIVINIENRLMLQMAPTFSNLPLMQKVEVFEHALCNTTGQDLEKMLWLRSSSAEIWLGKRTEFTRSLAVMSMVGYILGLGDRHPSNVMLDRYVGKLIHIDFGDCFEVAMNRDKFPEKFPFRLTRMLVEAMEMGGVEGNFRITCQHVMRLIREHKESVQAVLEAFAYDPLINWRLANMLLSNTLSQSIDSRCRSQQSQVMSMAPQTFISQLKDNADLNKKAVTVLKRVSQKLRGRDFNDGKEYTVNDQVNKLILEAMSHENLCQAYLGWCPLW